MTLDFRQEPVGGEVYAPPEVTPRHGLAGASHLVLLVHGYNNDRAEGLEAYRGFHERQEELDSSGRYSLGRTFVQVVWPGDADWGIASFLFYMGSIKRAKQSASALAAFLAANVAGPVRMDVVAHSMGCRLVLELLGHLGRSVSLQVGRIVFMAGAVPTFMLEGGAPPGALRPAYDLCVAEGARSLYSPADMVLSAAFPLGQTAAAVTSPGEGVLPAALGREFWVHPTVPLNLGQAQVEGAGHSDYWGWNERPAPLERARRAAGEIRDYLRFCSAGSREVAAHPVTERSAIAAREVAKRREIEARAFPMPGA